jgi:hypothetical protein
VEISEELVASSSEVFVKTEDQIITPIVNVYNIVDATHLSPEASNDISTIETQTLDAVAPITVDEETMLVVAEAEEDSAATETMIATRSKDPTICSVIRVSENVEIGDESVTDGSEEIVVKPEDELVLVIADAPEPEGVDDTINTIPSISKAMKEIPTNKTRTLEAGATFTMNHEASFVVAEAEEDPAAEIIVVHTQLEHPTICSVKREGVDLVPCGFEEPVGKLDDGIVADAPDPERELFHAGEQTQTEYPLPKSESLSETTVAQAEIYVTELQMPTIPPAIEAEISAVDTLHAIEGGFNPVSLTAPDESLEVILDHSTRAEDLAVDKPPAGADKGVLEVADLVSRMETESGVAAAASLEYNEVQVSEDLTQDESLVVTLDDSGIIQEFALDEAPADTAKILVNTSEVVELEGHVQVISGRDTREDVCSKEAGASRLEEAVLEPEAEITAIDTDMLKVAEVEGEPCRAGEEESVHHAPADVESYRNIPVLETESYVAPLEISTIDHSIEAEIPETDARPQLITENKSLDITDLVSRDAERPMSPLSIKDENVDEKYLPPPVSEEPVKKPDVEAPAKDSTSDLAQQVSSFVVRFINKANSTPKKTIDVEFADASTLRNKLELKVR